MVRDWNLTGRASPHLGSKRSCGAAAGRMTGSAVLQDARGPELPLDAWLVLPCSFPKLDVRAWRSAILQEQSTMRDEADKSHLAEVKDAKSRHEQKLP